MKLLYNLDISEESSSLIHTPGLASRQLPFYVHGCGHFHAGGGYYTEREALDNYLLIFTVSGSGYLKYKEREYWLKPGQIFFIDCNEYQYYRTGNAGAWELRWLHMNGSACRHYFDLLNEDALTVVELADASEISRYLNEIPSLILKNDLNSDLKISMLLTNILTELVINRHNLKNNKSYAQHSSMLESVIDHIQCHYREEIKIKDLLKIFHTSEYHFMRLFKRYTGVSAYEYITNHRINKSKQLLKETTLPVFEIAYRVGFNNVINYMRDFKKVVGTTPLKFRNYWVS